MDNTIITIVDIAAQKNRSKKRQTKDIGTVSPQTVWSRWPRSSTQKLHVLAASLTAPSKQTGGGSLLRLPQILRRPSCTAGYSPHYPSDHNSVWLFLASLVQYHRYSFDGDLQIAPYQAKSMRGQRSHAPVIRDPSKEDPSLS